MSSVIERTIKGGAGFFTANLVSKGFGFLFIVVASRFLGPMEFGILSLGLSVTGVARNFAAFGLPNTIQRFLSGHGEKQSAQIYSAILLMGGVAATLSAAGLYLVAPWLSASFFDEPTLTSTLRILSVGVIVGVGATLLRAVLQAQEHIKQIVILDTIRSVAKVILALLIFVWVQTASGAAWAVVASFGLALIVAWRYVRRIDIRPSFEGVKAELRTVLGYSAPLVVVGFSYFLAQQADRLMLGWLSDVKEVGLYTVTSTLAMVMSTLNSAFAAIFHPIASQGYRNKAMEKVGKSYLFISKWGAVANGVALFAFAVFGPELLKVFGPSYATDATYWVLLLLAGFYFFNVWVGPTGAFITMADGHRAEFVNTLAFVAINISLNYLLILNYGIIGAAAATFVSGAIWNIVQLIQIYVWYKISVVSRQNITILGLVIFGVFISITLDSISHKVILSSLLTVGMMSYAIWDSSDEEKKLLLKIKSRFV